MYELGTLSLTRPLERFVRWQPADMHVLGPVDALNREFASDDDSACFIGQLNALPAVP